MEALKAVEKQFQAVEKHSQQPQVQETLEHIAQKTRIVHIFDREGDIAEVFDPYPLDFCNTTAVLLKIPELFVAQGKLSDEYSRD